MTLKQKIQEAKEQGMSYNQIAEKLGCSKGTVSYHLSKEQRDKTLKRKREWRRNAHPYCKKIDRFRHHSRSIKVYKQVKAKSLLLLDLKTKNFQKGSEMPTFTTKDVIDKIGENPKCYLTGRTIDINNTSSYHFDHIVPISKGGSNELDNLGICTKEANMAKSELLLEDFYALCEDVIKTRERIELS